jgi:hypothetical protein
VIPQYEALWADMASLRPANRPARARNSADNPRRLDPYRLFNGYPSEWLSPHSVLRVTPGVTPEEAGQLLSAPIVKHVAAIFPKLEEVETIVTSIQSHRQARVSDVLTVFPQPRRVHIERFLLTLAKYGLISIMPSGPQSLER